MRALLDAAGVRRCACEGAPPPTQCGGGEGAACGCGFPLASVLIASDPPCFFTLQGLEAKVCSSSPHCCDFAPVFVRVHTQVMRKLPGKDREEQAARIVAALELDGVKIRPKGLVGKAGSQNWPVVGFRLDDELTPGQRTSLQNTLQDIVAGQDISGMNDADAKTTLRRFYFLADPTQGDAPFDELIAGLRAFHEARGLPDLDIAKAQMFVGGNYRSGEGVPQDYTEARRLFGLAAVQGVAHAQFLLGSMHLLGEGGPQDYTEARRLLTLAAEAEPNHAQAQLHLAFAEAVLAAEAEPSYAKARDVGEAVQQLGLHAGQSKRQAENIAETVRLLGLLDAGQGQAGMSVALAPPLLELASGQGQAEALDTIDSVDACAKTPVLLKQWRCVSCDTVNCDEVCTGNVRGRQCNSRRSTGIDLNSSKRSRGTETGGASQSHESASGASSSSSGGAQGSRVARRGAQSSNTPGRGKGRARSGNPSDGALAATPEPGDLDTIVGGPSASPMPDGEGDEDAPIRKMIEALVQSPENVTKDAGFVPYDQLLLSDDVLSWSSKHYIFPLREKSRGEDGAPTGGLLLVGAPGTGKTALAKAMAVKAGAKLLPIGNSKVLSQWAGKADRTVAAIFTVARQVAPCVVFFDEVEKMLQSTASGSADAHSNVTNEFKAQADPEALRQQGIVLIAATNHFNQLETAVVDRLGAFVRELPPLTDRQCVTLLKRTLPEGHQLTDEDVGEVMEQVQQGGSIRRLQGLGAMIVNCARSPDGSKVPPTREHVLEALEEVRKTEAQTEKAAATRAAAQSGVVGSRVGYE